MFLPRLEEDRDDTISNSVEFDGAAQVRLSDLLLATRQASMTLVGWRLFGSMLRGISARAGESEVKLRTLM